MPTYFNYGDYPDWQQAMGYIAGQPLRAESPDQTIADASAQLAFLPVPEPLGAVARLRQLDASHVQCAQHEDPQLDYPPAQLAHPESLRSLPKVARGYRKAFYARPEVLTALDKQTRKTTNLMLGYNEVYGKRVLTFRDIPVREQESLLATESKVA